MNNKIMLILVGLLFATPAFAQAPGPVQQSWLPQGRAALSVSSVTGNVALPTGLVSNICNTGSVDAYLNFGTANTVTATTGAGYLLRAGYCSPYSRSNFGETWTYVAAITASSTTTLAIEGGTGTPLAMPAVPGSISGTVTANQGTAGASPWLFALPTGASTAANQTSVQAPVTPATATATVSELIGCRYVSAGVAFTDLQQGAVSCDATGRLLATLLSAGPVAPGTAATKSNLGGAVYTAAGVAPSDGQQVAVQVDQNGRELTVNGLSARVTNTPTVQNAAYSSGNCIGGFQAITITNYNGQSGYLTNFRLSSFGGSTPTITVYVFDSNPSGSTCTDKSTFTLAAADVDKQIISPAAMTLAAPTGTTVSFGAVDWTPPRPFFAGGSAASGVKTIYYALVSGSTFTPATTTDIKTSTGAALN